MRGLLCVAFFAALIGCGSDTVTEMPPAQPAVKPSNDELRRMTAPDGRPLSIPEGATTGARTTG